MGEALSADFERDDLELVRKATYTADEIQLAMKILLAKRSNAKHVRMGISVSDDGDISYRRILVTRDKIDWAYHVCEKMVYSPSWQIVFS